VPVCEELLVAARAAGEIRADVGALGLMYGVGNLCIGANDVRYDPRLMVEILLAGLKQDASALGGRRQLRSGRPNRSDLK